MASECDLDELRRQAASCTACDLYCNATQTVFGEGRPGARVMLVGEQPGDKEDLAGEPFVGPAGALLDKALTAAGIDREDAYVTNVVKHFKWRPAGKRRLHQKPNAAEVAACRPWLDAELACVQPKVVVLLGATAAQALLGRGFKVTEQRGRFVDWTPLTPSGPPPVAPDERFSARPRTAPVRQRAQNGERGSGGNVRGDGEGGGTGKVGGGGGEVRGDGAGSGEGKVGGGGGTAGGDGEGSSAGKVGSGGGGSGGGPRVLATVHPSSILRAPSDEARHAQMDAFIADLRVAAAALRGG